MDSLGERFSIFKENNKHIDFEIFQAIKGTDVSASERVRSGLLSAECAASGLVTDGTLGCAASHRELWKVGAASSEGLLIMEDGRCYSPQIIDFLEKQTELLSVLPI